MAREHVAPKPFIWEYAQDQRFLYLYLNGVQLGSVIGLENGDRFHWGFNTRKGDVEATHGFERTIDAAVRVVNGHAAAWLVEVVQMVETTVKRGGF